MGRKKYIMVMSVLLFSALLAVQVPQTTAADEPQNSYRIEPSTDLEPEVSELEGDSGDVIFPEEELSDFEREMMLEEEAEPSDGVLQQEDEDLYEFEREFLPEGEEEPNDDGPLEQDQEFIEPAEEQMMEDEAEPFDEESPSEK